MRTLSNHTVLLKITSQAVILLCYIDDKKSGLNGPANDDCIIGWTRIYHVSDPSAIGYTTFMDILRQY